jgi:pSer/pThr/pTyr-binding forkhead associated (FHA) protein
MSAAANENELTSTLHLGLRSVVDGSPESALSRFLQNATEEEKAAYKSITAGSDQNAMIFIHRGPSKGSRFLIDSNGVRIGRNKDSDIFLDDVTVSRSHAKISMSASGFKLEDLGSLNGTYVNNAQTSGVSLTSGDEIQIGKFHMLFVSANIDKTGEK